MKDTLWKYIATGAVSICITLGGAWFSLNAQAVKKAEVQEMIAPDHAMQAQMLEEIRQLRQDVARMDREIGEIKGLLSRK